MIEEMHIRSLGVIRDARLPLGPGLTVITGETGCTRGPPSARTAATLTGWLARW